ncbi:unnamed protein product [Bursaphelenchus okinawaensis]|uniref:MFS domain-containing protein n=1 Tax=Bursaphelenchus okinawaensis TaxID=465554 RepID=A0A811LEY8_9BILA|nr:unnamed protein product [Bursaphelenchus okinawaensis]CAG9121943.1 unnamed protein product [Bursaphelenchus okinawaensis]
MKIAIVVALISIFQIYHQAAASALSLLHFGLTNFQLSLISATFPLGKLVGTLSVVSLYKSFTNRHCLDFNAHLLFAGCALQLLPSYIFFCLGRFIAGIGVGIGFVSAPICIKDMTSYHERPKIFFLAAVIFSGSAVFSSILPFFKGIHYMTFCFLMTLPSFGACVLYYKYRDLYIEPIKEEFEDEYVESMSTYVLFNPRFLAYTLMVINATIGVPVILSYSSVIFNHLNIPPHKSAVLSMLYPLVQVFCLYVASQMDKSVTRRMMVIVGFGICLAAFFALMLTQAFSTLDASPEFKAMASAFWFIILAGIMAVPCNSGLCIISELFTSRYALFRGVAYSRAIFWFLSAVITSTFLPMLDAGSLFTALLPSFVISLICYVYICMLLPDDLEHRGVLGSPIASSYGALNIMY